MSSTPKCALCGLLPMELTFDGIPICGECNTQITNQFIEFSEKRIPKKSFAVQIDESLYIGDEDAAHNLEDLEAKGIQNILIAGSYLHAWYEDKFKYMQLPIKDCLEENLLRHLNSALDFHFTTPGKTLVHCGAGISRSGSIVIAYLMKKYALSFEEAFAMAKEKSARIHPNSSFQRQLREWGSTST